MHVWKIHLSAVLLLTLASCGSRTPLPSEANVADASAATSCGTCADLNAECGTITNSCGESLVCGSCAAPLVCGGNGAANRCGCQPTTCAASGADCGEALDGCNGIITCGTCPPVETCGGSGPNKCGPSACDPQSC